MTHPAPNRRLPLAGALLLALLGTEVAYAAPSLDMSPLGLYLQADAVVKGVMLLLAAASVCTWAIWIAKTIELRIGRRHVQGAIERLGAVGGFKDIGPCADPDTRSMLNVALEELQSSRVAGARASEGIKERAAARVQRLEARAGRRLTRGASVLAAVGSVGPFVGLFGTVWGVMNSFVGIASTQTTNLAVVAPGIAEALLATGAGLAAAIPAVVGYNLVARGVSEYRLLLAEAATLVMCVLSRELDTRSEEMPLAAVALTGERA